MTENNDFNNTENEKRYKVNIDHHKTSRNYVTGILDCETNVLLDNHTAINNRLNKQNEIISKLKTDLKYETRINNGKRFEASDRIIIDNQTKLHYICTLDWEVSLIVRLLNNLHEENNELKEKYNEQSVEYEGLEEQIERLLDFRDNVFNLINKKLKEADKGFEQTHDEWYQGQVDALKELKKELIKGKSK